uniref:NACHT domain-containing protein n=1 Tax=Knipowitschia caucasica TaxID=637954 RepID=A0AAV2LCK7_KNICA
MANRSHYDSFLDRSKRIMWQDDCYMDLQSSSSSPVAQTDTEDSVWIQQHQQQFCRFSTGPFLQQMITHLKSMNVLSPCEEARIQRAAQLADQVTALISVLLSGKSSSGFSVMRHFVEKSDSLEAQLIIKHDVSVQEHKDVLLRRCGEHRDKVNMSHLCLLLVEEQSDLQQKEHDLMQVQATHGNQRRLQKELSLSTLLEPLTQASTSPRLSLTIGVAGVGKTTWIRHLVRMWSRGAICPDISFVLPFSCCELNSLEKVSVEKLLKMAFPHLPEAIVLSSSCRSLLILDGLDHFRSTLNFTETDACSDPKKEVSMAICWIVADTLKFIIQSNQGSQPNLPRTCTELFAHFCLMKAEIGEPRGRESVKSELLHMSNRKLMWSLARLAFNALVRHKYSFSEQELRAYGIDQALQQCSLGRAVLKHEESLISTVYRFTHLCIQEFFAAVYYYVSSKRAIFDLFSESTVSWPKIGFQNHFRNSFHYSQKDDSGHFDVFVRFLSGLLNPNALTPLSALVALWKDDGSQKAWAAGFIHSLLSDSGPLVSLRSVNLAYCLYELQHMELLRSVEEDLRQGSLSVKMCRAQCVVLSFLLHVSPECSLQTNLSHCLNYSSVKSLLPQLLYCNHLRLENNQFKDDVMELLGSLLSAKDCHIRKLSLADNSITNKGVKAISRALLVNRTLTSLNLRSNNIGSKGVKFLAEALKTNQALVSVNLQNNGIDKEGAHAAAEVLKCNRNLVYLNLKKNLIGAEGVKNIAEALKTNRSLKTLVLCSNQVGDKGTAALAEALRANHTLLSLQLQCNSISNKGTAALTEALRLNHGLLSLNLRENSIGVNGAQNMAKALYKNRTLQELDLTANLLHDEGVQAIAGAIKFNQSLRSLHLQWNFIKSAATKALAQALLHNTALQLLDLQENAIGNEGIASLAEALKSNASLQTLCLQGVSAGTAGVVALAESLTTNQSLQSLDLRGNAVGIEGAKALANALKTNRTLKSLNMQENSLGMDGAIFLATALKGNTQLSYLNLQGNGVGQSGAKVISDAIKNSAPGCDVHI